MEYNIHKTVPYNFDEAKSKVTAGLKEAGFGIITEIDLKEKFKEKLEVDFRAYTILGACNPKLAYEAIQKEANIGIMLPCNVLVQEHTDGKVEVAAINPLVSIGAVGNNDLQSLAEEAYSKIKAVINQL